MAREAALQMLFALEVSEAEVERVITLFFAEFGDDPESRSYAEETVRGYGTERGYVDDIVRRASEHWRLERMTRVDRAVLRLGAWELLRRLDVPRAVILDEAVELAKKFGSEESGAFVNGVLNRVAEDLARIDTDR